MMAKKSSIPIRTDPNFVREIKDMQIQRRLSKGVETKPSRITLAVTRHDLFRKIKQDIIDADLK